MVTAEVHTVGALAPQLTRLRAPPQAAKKFDRNDLFFDQANVSTTPSCYE